VVDTALNAGSVRSQNLRTGPTNATQENAAEATAIDPIATGSFSVNGAASSTYFTQIVPIMDKYCVACHSTDAKNVVILDNYAALIGGGTVLDKWLKVLQYVESETMPPPPAPGLTGAELATLKQWVESGAQTAPTNFQLGLQCTARVPPTANVRALTPDEIANTLRDLLPQQLFKSLAKNLASYPNAGQPGTMDVLTTSVNADYLGAQYALAKTAADLLVSQNADRVALVPCFSSADKATCLGQFLPAFAAKAFRRPLTSAENATQAAVLADALKNTDPITALAAAVQSILFSPNFYMLTNLGAKDAGNPYHVDDYGIAARLSYALWGSMPDDELTAAAAAGDLSQAAALKTEVDRMLADPKFQTHLDHVTSQWLSLDQITAAGANATAQQALITSMQNDILMTVRQVVAADNGKFSDLFTTPTAYVDSAALATIYGLPATTPFTPEYVKLDPKTRSGILTRAGILSYTVTPVLTTIRRAHFIRQNILGQDIGTPPANVTLLPVGDNTAVSLRDRLTASTKSYQCSFCHNQLNPIGFALGNYAADGTYQTTETAVTAAGDSVTLPINTTVDPRIDVLGRDMVTGAVDLETVVGRSKDARLTFAKDWYVALAGAAIDPENACVVTDMFNVIDADKPVVDMIKSYVASPEFLLRSY